MSAGLCFWIMMLVWFVWGFWNNRANLPAAGGDLLIFLLFLLLGWRVFGAPVHG